MANNRRLSSTLAAMVKGRCPESKDVVLRYAESKKPFGHPKSSASHEAASRHSKLTASAQSISQRISPGRPFGRSDIASRFNLLSGSNGFVPATAGLRRFAPLAEGFSPALTRPAPPLRPVRGAVTASALSTLTVLGLLALLPGITAHAQSSGVVAIRAGKILTMNGPAITNGVILIRSGKIVEVGPKVKIPADAQIIDARTRVVMPGLVAAYSTLGVGADPEESISPDIRARDTFDYFADYKSLLRGGLTTVYLSTSAHRLVSGQGAVVKLAGDNPATRTLRSPADVRVMLGTPAKTPPALFRPAIPPTTDNPLLPAQHQLPSARPAQFAVLRQFFADARRLGKGSLGHPIAVGASDAGLHLAERDEKLRTVLPILNQQEPLRINANTALDIRQALDFADEQHIKIVLEGVTEGWRLADEIAHRHIPVVARTPLQPGRTVAADYTRDITNGKVNVDNIALLVRAGVTVALEPTADSDLTDLLFLAGSQAAYGLSPENALKTITVNAAEAMGVGNRIGSISPGHDADLLILSGAPLATTTHIDMTLVNGSVVYTRPAAVTPAGSLTAIRAGKILTVTQGVIENGVILIRDGKIVGINRDGVYPADAHVIDASHSVVMPGIIDTQSFLGLHTDTEPSLPSLGSAGPRAGGRRRGGGQFLQQAPVQTAGPTGASTRMKLVEALLPGDPAFAEALRGGVTEVLLSPPVSGTLCGQATLLKTLPGSYADPTSRGRVVKETAAIVFNMQGEPRMGQPWLFRDLLTASKGYQQRSAQAARDHKQWEQDRDDAKLQKKDPPIEPEFTKDEDQEPLAAMFRGEIPAFVHANRADEIMAALKVFRDENSLPLTLVEAADGFRVAEEIRKRNTSVVLGPEILRTDKGQIVNNAEALSHAGVSVQFASGSGSGTQFLRLSAANAVRHGMDPEEALRALTLNPARTLHVENRLGSIEVGKDADLVILNGDPLEVTTHVEKAIVNGKVAYDAK
jgi:imidazolonepropionase-like amidohydrolase